MLSHLHLISGCCDVTTAEPSNCDKDLMALSLKYIPSNPLQKMFADLCDTEARKNWKMGHKVNPIFCVFILIEHYIKHFNCLLSCVFTRLLGKSNYYSYFTDKVTEAL